MSVRILSCVTCMHVDVRGHWRDLIGVFRALPSVPRGCLVVLEVEAFKSFGYSITLLDNQQRVVPGAREITRVVDVPPSGRVEITAALPLSVAGVLPGAYTVRAAISADTRLPVDRPIFLGEL